jgi:hypothetical protein
MRSRLARTLLAALPCTLLAALACSDPAPPERAAPPPAAEPPSPPPLDGVDAITSGSDETCALRGGKVYCWRVDDDGEAPTTVAIADLPAIGAVDAGGKRACALAATGDLHCWGETTGEDPRGLSVGVMAPTRLDFGRPVTRVEVGLRQICALTDRRDLYCWGASSGGEVLPRPIAMKDALRLATDVSEVTVGDGWLRYSAGGKRYARGPAPALDALGQQQNIQTPGWVLGTCGVSNDGHVQCRGTHELVPRGGGRPGEELVTVPGLDRVVELAVGQDLACAIRADRSVWCWTGARPARAIPLPGRARQIAAGLHHACALLADDGAVLCWSAARDPVAVRARPQARAGAGALPTIRVETATGVPAR